LIDFGETMTPERVLAISITSALVVFGVVLFCEWLHAKRVEKVAGLAFGPGGGPRKWTKAVPGFRAVVLAGITWALTFLLLTSQTLFVDPNNIDQIPEDQIEHVMLLLDLSPSMMLVDAGETGEISRRDQMKGVVSSIVERFGKHVRYTLVCFYTRPMPMVEDAFDKAIIYNVLDDLPIEKTMGPGKTNLAKAVSKGLELAAEKRADSTTVIVCTDGDTVEIEDLHYLPPSVMRWCLAWATPRKASRSMATCRARIQRP
jgi:Ca-activated chloride channel homolog